MDWMSNNQCRHLVNVNKAIFLLRLYRRAVRRAASAGLLYVGGSDAAMTDDATLLRKSTKRILTGTELLSIGLEPYRAQLVVSVILFIFRRPMPIDSDSVIMAHSGTLGALA